MHGCDFGRYTEWKRPESPPKPIDFVIGGVSSGTYTIKTFDINLPEFLKEPRFMSYHFYESGPGWKAQADKFAVNSEKSKAKALWWDYERGTYSILDKRTAFETAEALAWLGQRFPRAGMYANIYDFVANFQKHVGDLANAVEWWVAWPAGNESWEPRWEYPWGKPNRPFSSCRLYQYSWKGVAPDYGATNDKQAMDLDVSVGDDLDKWLGIEQTDEKVWQQIYKVEGLDLRITVEKAV